jgi:hypothetical protein
VSGLEKAAAKFFARFEKDYPTSASKVLPTLSFRGTPERLTAGTSTLTRYDHRLPHGAASPRLVGPCEAELADAAQRQRCRDIAHDASGEDAQIEFHFGRLSVTSFTIGRAENTLGHPA